MKSSIAILIAFIVSLTAVSQTYIQDGDMAFERGDYTSAIDLYEISFNQSSGKDKQIAEIKLSRAKWCAEHIIAADKAFSLRYYITAISEYEKVLDSNPKDYYAQQQIEKCNTALNPKKLRTANNADLTDIWNLKYGVPPDRRQNLINAGIDPDDAEKRIKAGEAKPPEKNEQPVSLIVSNSYLYFTSEGEDVKRITVNTTASHYSIPLEYVASWCIITRFNGYFTVKVLPNTDYTSRSDWFLIRADDKEVKVFVEQSGAEIPFSKKSSKQKKQVPVYNVEKCFNCPKTDDRKGFTIGYTQQTIESIPMDVIQVGFKVEPLFKYGFGMNTGINFLTYSGNLFDSQFFSRGFEAYALNIPFHLEYRLNFSKWFNIFAFSGVGFNAMTNSNFIHYTLPPTFEYGGGMRINRLQFNVAWNVFLDNFGGRQDFNQNTNAFFSMSYMF